jgi:two-component system CheB/CheR fusion protein
VFLAQGVLCSWRKVYNEIASYSFIQFSSEMSTKPSNKTRKKEPEAKHPVEPTNRPQSLTVVGIGASAGGLNALNTFFDALAPDTGMAFVVVTHLHPDHESHMAELLQKHTQMPATQVSKKVKVEPNHVYVIPPNRSILLTDTHLEAVEFTEPHGKRSPIDAFFRSLASEHRESIAIILSGGGTDGSVGIKDVKESGGVIMAQHPSDAEYNSMPLAAMSTGLVDVVLPVDQLAKKLMDYVQHRPQLPHDPGQLSEQEAETFQRILSHVHARTGQDFNQYKRSTILRRVERRMQLNGFPKLDGYLNFLRQHPNEAQSMFNDILIGVTNFFRDHDPWKALEEKVMPRLFQNKENADEIRIWTIGCATGEEAYGLAMLLLEEAARHDVNPRLQIFASDLDENSIARAREGLYPASIEADVSPERLERFFVREGEYFRVKHEIRDIVLFTNHNILRDPPFSRQDLIACRNLLIYLQREVQDKVFDIFHYALNPGGFLFLGSSESAEHLSDMYEVADKANRLYIAKPWHAERRQIPALPLTLRRRHPAGAHGLPGALPSKHYSEMAHTFEDHHEKALESYAPPSVIINENQMILHVSETAGRYLVQPRGPITGEVLKLVRPELQMALRSAIFQAFENGRAIVSSPVLVQFNGHPHKVVLAVRPRIEPRGLGGEAEKQALVLFLENELDESEHKGDGQTDPSDGGGEHHGLVSQLQSEILNLREQLQVTIEEYDSSNEEMKAANEELQSINEEYRSATEELETSKEELQSINEELQTVNNDMKNKLEELAQAHMDLENLMGASEIGTLFLDRELRIKRFTAGVNNIINILSTDRGRPIQHLTHKLKGYDFIEDAEQVLRHLTSLEREVQTEEGNYYQLRFRPFRTIQDHIEGVVITFINITALKARDEQLLEVNETLEQRVSERTHQLDLAYHQISQARDLFYALFNANPVPSALLSLEDGVFLNVNDAYARFAGRKRDEMLGHAAQEFGLPLDPTLQPEVVARVQELGIVRDLELEVARPSGEIATVLASIQLIHLDETPALVLSFIDITERARAEQEIRMLASDLTVAEQEERRRISQILHDDLQQRIFAVKMQTSMLRDAYQQGNFQSAQVDFDQLEEMLDTSITITRNLSIDLSPAVLQGEGLTDALIWLAVQMNDQYGLQVSIHTNGISTQCEDTLRILLFQAVREALFNVVKHGGTAHAQISISKTVDDVFVTISDDGRGFDASAIFDESQGSGGLMNIRHRLQLMGCDLEVESQPGQGTRLVIRIPAAQVAP